MLDGEVAYCPSELFEISKFNGNFKKKLRQVSWRAASPAFDQCRAGPVFPLQWPFVHAGFRGINLVEEVRLIAASLVGLQPISRKTALVS